MTSRRASGDGDVRSFWDARAERYDSHYDDAGPDGYSLQARLSLTRLLLGDGPGTLLDSGMGAGRLCEALASRHWTVFGVDTSREMVALARERLPEARDRLLEASIEELPFPDGSFDAVASTGALEYTDVPRALSEVARVLRPGGSAVTSYPNPNALYARWKSHVWYRVMPLAKRVLGRAHSAAPKGGPRLSPNRFAGLLEAHGLQVASVHYTGYLLLPSPLDELFPSLTSWLGARLEGARPWVGRVLATQVVYVSQKQL